jgi:hypothetical protein
LLSLYSIPHMIKAILSIEEILDWSKINRAGPKIEKWIKMEALYLNSFVLFTTVLSYVSAVTHAIPIEDDNDIFYPLAIFEEFFPQCQNVLSSLYRATFFLVPLIMSTPCYLVIYITSKMRFQFYMLLHFLKRINSGYETSDINQLINDRQYQEEIKKRLKFCVKWHTQLYE